MNHFFKSSNKPAWGDIFSWSFGSETFGESCLSRNKSSSTSAFYENIKMRGKRYIWQNIISIFTQKTACERCLGSYDVQLKKKDTVESRI